MLDNAGMAVIEQDLEDLRKSYELDFTKHVDSKDIPRIILKNISSTHKSCALAPYLCTVITKARGF